MSLLGVQVGGQRVPIAINGSLVFPPAAGCQCCERYRCKQGGVPCQECVRDDAGEYATMEDCQEQCPQKLCVWCVEQIEYNRCGDSYMVYGCTTTSCDTDGDCIVPSQAVVAGPVVYEAGQEPECFCPPSPEVPPDPECCDDGECGCCYQCVDGVCVYGCPDGYACLGCECVPPEEYYYCCREPGTQCSGSCQWEATAYDPVTYAPAWLLTVPCADGCDCLPPEASPTYPGEVYMSSCTNPGGNPGATFCQTGPCQYPYEYVSGPHSSLVDCCAVCGCRYECAVPGYSCFPDPLGPYASLEACQSECVPPGSLGTCCYTIAPHTQDNTYNNPPSPLGCAIEKGCFGIMTFADCESRKTNTGTNTYWYSEFLDCELCPITQSRPCCYEDPEQPCVLLCHETDENCCDELGGTLYNSLTDCADTWPSGREACRPLQCSWPPAQSQQGVASGGCTCDRSQDYTSPEIQGDCSGAAIQVQWQAGYPTALNLHCNWTWVRNWSRCGGGNAAANNVCQEYRILAIKHDGTVVDLTATAVVNVADLTCCVCTINYGQNPCLNNECQPLAFYPDPVPVCLP